MLTSYQEGSQRVSDTDEEGDQSKIDEALQQETRQSVSSGRTTRVYSPAFERSVRLLSFKRGEVETWSVERGRLRE